MTKFTLAILGGIVGVGALVCFNSIINGYVLTVLWDWFMVPTFGLPHLSLAPAIGMALVVSYLTHQSIPSSEKEDKEDIGLTIAKAVFRSVAYPALVLLFGGIVHSFM